MPDPSSDQLFELAMAKHEAGSLEEAEELYRRILRDNPDDADALQLLGVLDYQLGNLEASEHSLRRAAKLQPEAWDCYYHLGVVCAAARKHADAIASLQTANKLYPDAPEILQKLADALQIQERNDEAIATYRKVISLRPDWTDALTSLGNALQSKNQWAEAAEVSRTVTERRPEDPMAWFALGNSLHMARRHTDAIAAYDKAIQLRPDFVEVHTNLADALAKSGQLDAALAEARRAIELRPDFHLAWNNLGNTYLALQRPDDAIDAFQKAVANRSDYAEGFYNLGNAFRMANRLEDSAGAYSQAIRAKADYFMAYNNLAIVLKEMRQLSEAMFNFHQAMVLRPDHPTPHSNYISSLHYPYGIDPDVIFGEHLVWNNRHARRVARLIEPHGNDRSGDRPLRVGYVSADFREHSVGFFLVNLFEHHDPKEVQIYCYSDSPKSDYMTDLFRAKAHAWRETAQMEPEHLAHKIRTDKIDILIDLSGHGGGSRLPVFALKPAPVQITYLGYPDTTGLHTIAYRFTDALADPAGETERFHTEELLRLPRTFLSYWPNPSAPEVSPLPCQSGEPFTFGSFNALGKITAPMIDLWSKILHAVPASRLLIKSHSGLTESSPRRRLLEIFASCGIAADRIQLHSQTKTLNHHLELYSKVDLALDTFPYHGTATTCEALWMGVPVVTLAGSRHVSRVGVSLLTNVGLSEFIAPSPDQYVNLAVRAAADPAALAKLRAGLRQMMRQSPLLGGRQFARDVESAYRRVWRKWTQNPA
jgi:protein O-GlcNAc transferase